MILKNDSKSLWTFFFSMGIFFKMLRILASGRELNGIQDTRGHVMSRAQASNSF